MHIPLVCKTTILLAFACRCLSVRGPYMPSPLHGCVFFWRDAHPEHARLIYWRVGAGVSTRWWLRQVSEVPSTEDLSVDRPLVHNFASNVSAFFWSCLVARPRL